MPTYEYECKSCGYDFDFFQSMKDEPLKTCPKCGKELRRLINGGTGIIFKGGGFYITDKSGGSSALPNRERASSVSSKPKTAEESHTPPAKTESFGAAKTESAPEPKKARSSVSEARPKTAS